jgi:ATP-dependent DNA helicase RecG
VLFKNKGRLARTTSDEAYIRLGSSKKKLSEDEIRELEIDRGEVDFEKETSGLVYPEDFDTELIHQFAKSYKTKRGISEDYTDEEILKLTHLGLVTTIGFIPNNACVLLFAKDPRLEFPGCKIRFLRFDGEYEGTGEKFNAVKDIWIDSGPLPKLIVEAEKVMDAQVREFNRLGTDGIFYTAPEYPKLAWYEAIVNACAHRSYGLKNMNIFIKMFDDRLVIESPGSFPQLITPENIYDNSHPRNPYLFEAMFYLNFVKCAHEGTRRMRDTMKAMELPTPEFEQKEMNYALVRVTLRNNIKHRKVWIDKDASAVVGAVLSHLLSEHEKRIINFIAEHGNISVSQAQRLTGKSWPAASKILIRTQEVGCS